MENNPGIVEEGVKLSDGLLAELCPDSKIAMVSVGWVSKHGKVGIWHVMRGVNCSSNEVVTCAAAGAASAQVAASQIAESLAEENDPKVSKTEVLVEIMNRQLKIVERQPEEDRHHKLIIKKDEEGDPNGPPKQD